MLYLIGIGLKPEHLTEEALEAIGKCEKVFLESYTSVYSEGSALKLEERIEKKTEKLFRDNVEQGLGEVLEEAKLKDVALLIYGNALSATTHTQILLDAKKEKVSVTVIPGISIFDFLGKTGLSQYKFGKAVTIVRKQENYAPESFYDGIVKNKKAGMHTLCLLDIEIEGHHEQLMSVKAGVKRILEIEKSRKKNELKKAEFVAISKAGSSEEKILFGNAKKMMESFLDTPASLIVCADLSEKEREFLEEFYAK